MKKINYARLNWLCIIVIITLLGLLLSWRQLVGMVESVAAQEQTRLTGPVITMTTAVTSPTNQSPIIVGGQFSEPATGSLGIEDIIVDNGSLDSLEVEGQDRFTLTLSLTDVGLVMVTIPPGVVTGTISNQPNQMGEFEIFYDPIPPIISLIGNNPFVVLRNMPYEEPGAVAFDNIDGDITDNIVIDNSAVDTTQIAAYQVIYTVSDQAGNSATTTRTVQVIMHNLYLPVLFKPFTVQGALDLSGDRSRDLTTFIPQATIDFSNLQFSAQPTEMRAWLASDQDSSNWEPYPQDATYVIPLHADMYGFQIVNVQFRVASGATSSVKQLMIFYIPNGDFQDSGTTGWSLSGQLGYSIGNGRLQLGNPHYGCTNVPLAVATASIDLQLPQSGNYYLKIEGDVFTYDQNPNNNATYDAFEVFLNQNLYRRFSNQAGPLDCDTQRTVDADLIVPLAAYSGSVSLRFENHNRFDNFYNTYTNITTVWVEATP